MRFDEIWLNRKWFSALKAMGVYVMVKIEITQTETFIILKLTQDRFLLLSKNNRITIKTEEELNDLVILKYHFIQVQDLDLWMTPEELINKEEKK